MKKENISFLKRFAEKLEEPEDLFRGRCLPSAFSLPDNILLFFHDFTAPVPNAHGRHTIVIPLDDMTYFVERKKIRLYPGIMLYIPPFAVRFLHPDSAGYRRLFITFDTKGHQPYLPETGAFELKKTFRELQIFLKEYTSGSIDNAAIALMNFLKLQEKESFHAFSESELPEILAQTISRIESQISEICGIKSLSDAVQISESRLRALFRQHMGISIGRFILEKKMDYARYRLLNSTASIAEIARNSGFANVYVFSAFFKRNAGISPMFYRNMNRKAPEKKNKKAYR